MRTYTEYSVYSVCPPILSMYIRDSALYPVHLILSMVNVSQYRGSFQRGSAKRPPSMATREQARCSNISLSAKAAG